ncbi:MAG TPA: RNA polymerase factor sigma-54 [Pseudogracilibacillus sp.]|nr:RNA polymerase factor sigma-54 [Pseudogracilibacillus sp.]
MKLVLQQKQQLNLVMTTELSQAIALLQYSTQDLYEFLKEQEIENPLLELVEKNDVLIDDRKNNYSIQSSEEYVDPIDFIASKEKTLTDQLLEQVNYKKIPEKVKQQLNYLILNLDEKGYLAFDKQSLAEDLKLTELEVDELINQLQLLEPIGVGAIDLANCLEIQLNYYYPDELLAKKIITTYLNELANKNWSDIAKKENVSLQEIQSAFEIIRSLNPKPASNHFSSSTTYVTPDIIIESDESDDTFTVHLNDHYLPSLRFDQSYLHGNKLDYQLGDFVQNQYKKYQWIKNSIEQRRNTIIKIMNVLLNKQARFFTDGLKSLKPLTLKEVALMIDMHESTVSRATDNKIIQTPAGTFELKSLFSTRLSTSSGEDISQSQVKRTLETIIKKEDKYKPLSDQKLAEQMKNDQGINISRRTIAKYRDELNIPSSSKRKEIKI